jgi:hypothetical protein
MHALLYVGVPVVAIVIAFIGWGFVRLRRGNSQASQAIRSIRIDEIDSLAAEGKRGLAKAYGITIDLTDREAAAKVLDGLFVDKMKLKKAFETPGFYWRFVLPVGALIGEYIRIHANGVWKPESDGPAMEIRVKDGTATCYPFNKVLKQLSYGEKSDLYAYLVAASELSSQKA